METLAGVLLSLVLIALTLVFINRFFASGESPNNLPPGTFGWPIIGEALDFRKPEKFFADRMKKHSPDIFRTKILGDKIAVICGPSGNKFFFSNESKHFAPFMPRSMEHFVHSEKTTRMAHSEATRLIREKLKPNAITRYVSEMDLTARRELEAHCAGKDVVEIYPLAKSVSLTLACKFLLGIDNPERISRLVKCFDDVTVGMFSIMIDFPGTAFRRGNRAAAEIRKELIAVIAEKKQTTSPSTVDVLSYMMNAKDPSGKSIPEDELSANMLGVLIAGYSTVARTITFMMKYVGSNVDVYEKVWAEQMEIARSKTEGESLEWDDMSKMKYSWNVIWETLRLVPPLQGNFREVVTEFSYGGYTVPKGWKVYWTMNSTNMNPAYFNEPERFNPSRYDEGETPYTNVPFGMGPRMCPAKEYSRLAMLAFLHNVAKGYKWEVVDPNEKVKGYMLKEPQKGVPVRMRRL